MLHKLGIVKHRKDTPYNKNKKTFVKTQLSSTLLLNRWSATCIFCKFSLLFLYFKKLNHSSTRRIPAPALDHISQTKKLSSKTEKQAKHLHKINKNTLEVYLSKQQFSLTTIFTSLIVEPATLHTWLHPSLPIIKSKHFGILSRKHHHIFRIANPRQRSNNMVNHSK